MKRKWAHGIVIFVHGVRALVVRVYRSTAQCVQILRLVAFLLSCLRRDKPNEG